MRPFPYEISDVEFKGQDSKVFQRCRVGPKKYIMFEDYRHFAEKLYNVQIRNDDVFVCGYPRSGTTLLEEMVWLLCNNLDFERGRSLGANERAFFFEIDVVFTKESEEHLKSLPGASQRSPVRLEHFDGVKGRRVFKSHLPLSLLPPDLLNSGAKVIYVARNPKDMLVSYYHYMQRASFKDLMLFTDLEDFTENFMAGNREMQPYFKFVGEFWQQRNHPNVLFIFYEDLVKDLRGMIGKISNFIDVELTESDLDLLETKLSFKNFGKYFTEGDFLKKKGDENDGHLRKGTFGESQKDFKGDLKVTVDRWIDENVRKYGIEYTYLD